ncbi:MAG: hypothetical protein JWR19_382 [Pedosphaera sp.]|nr:hypothetical protein [Pedosphaera sp.]
MANRVLCSVTLAALALLSGANGTAFAATANLSAVADTTLLQNNPNNNLGGHTNFAAGTMANGLHSRALLEFNIAGSIPTNAIINSVSLTLNVTAAASQSATFELHPMLASWLEGNKTGQLGAPATTGEATWNNRAAPGTAWGAAGGLAGTDFSATSGGSAFISTGTVLTFGSTSGLVADVQNWLLDPNGDFGWILLGQSESTINTARRFASREDGSGAGPTLIIDYSPVPEPSTLGLLGLAAGIGCWFRRRRAT